jgi:hypothetical protein
MKKWREKIDKSHFIKGVLTDRETRLINSYLRNSPGQLFPQFTVAYSRLALIDKGNDEKLTIDVNMKYQKYPEKKMFPTVMIAEVKQHNPSRKSEFIEVMRKYSIPPIRFSKYCFGIYLFYPFLKYNRFKSRYLFFEKVGNIRLVELRSNQ